ncbi:hypothetical protein QFC20_003281 [Naganishia adeliensis]|uniref:Uncharacterized protein n=1 Tax=Naganishia adeliensis TaxID=92952 RepID=A0ACC2WD21_9TREE|nr:hypothetical protein QFC20_003281 [Naganishia adeliensis]
MHGQVARLSSSLETTVDRELDADIRGAQAGTEDQQDTTEEGITQEEDNTVTASVEDIAVGKDIKPEDLDITTARRPPLVATIKDTSAESGAIREGLHQRQGDIKVVTGLRRGSEDIINPALEANRPTKVVSRLPVVSAIINPGTVAISHRPTMEVGSVTTAQAEATNRMGTAGRRQVMAAAERRMGIPDCTTHTDMQVADTGRDSKHTLHLTLARSLIRRYARSKHHASLMDKIEGKIEMTVGEKMHNPAMVAQGKAKYKGYSK